MSWVENIKTVTAGKINNPGEEKAWLSCEGWTPRRQEQMGISGLKWTPSWTLPPNCLPCEEVGGWRHPWGVTLSALGSSCGHSDYIAQCIMLKWLIFYPTGRRLTGMLDALECGYHLYQQLMFIHIICSGVTVSDDVTCSLFYGTQQLIKGTLHSYGTLLFSSDDWLDYTDLQFITLWRVIKMWGRPIYDEHLLKNIQLYFFCQQFPQWHACYDRNWLIWDVIWAHYELSLRYPPVLQAVC